MHYTLLAVVCQALSKASTEKGNGLTAGVLLEPPWGLLTESAWGAAWAAGVSELQLLAVKGLGSKVLLGALMSGWPRTLWSDAEIASVTVEEPFESIISARFERDLTGIAHDMALPSFRSLCMDVEGMTSACFVFSLSFHPFCTSFSCLLCWELWHNKKSL